MDGLFLENGPFRVEKNLSLSINEGGWQNYATNIYGKYMCLFLIVTFDLGYILYSRSTGWDWV